MAVKKSSKKNKKNSKKKNRKSTYKNKKVVTNQIKTTSKNKEIPSQIENKETKLKKKEKSIVKKKNTYKSLLVSFMIILSLTILVLYFPRIILKGEENIVISYQDVYKEPGYNGFIFNKDITNEIETSNNIDNGVIGSYEINYYINLPGARVKKTRNINIIDEINPVIKTKEDNIKICPNEEIPDIEFEATDEYDGNITTKATKIIKENVIILEVEDSSNNKTSKRIDINRVDEEPPTINLIGNSITYLTYGATYKEPGYKAYDNCDKDITDKVIVKGSVGRDLGTYELIYEVSDQSGNKVTITRKIIIGMPVNDYGISNPGTIYLTFDDGPNQGTTDKILDILKEENVKATFFVTSNGPDYLIKRIHEEGHTIALHTSTHNYAYIYASIDNYFNDLNQIRERVLRLTGVDGKIIRFPGGSSNTISRNYKIGIMTELSNIVLSKGYRYYDWNIDGMDASSARSSSDVYYNVTSHLSHSKANLVLLHDTKTITADAIREIIRFGKNYGYTFSGISMDTQMVRHAINN